MTRNEKRMLGSAIRQVIQHDKSAWLQLKQEIWELGYQSYYDSQGDFLAAAERVVSRLPLDVRSTLCIEWKIANPKRHELKEESFVAAYTLLVLEEVIKRARVAAYRTVNW